MASTKLGKPSFRHSVSMRLAQYPSWPKAPDDELAAWFGVTVEVLEEARRVRAGLERPHGDYQLRDGTSARQVNVLVPRPVMAAIDEFCAVRDVLSPTLLRSCCQAALVRPRLPMDDPNFHNGSGWTLFGRVHRLERRAAESGKKIHRSRIACYVTGGAHEALHHRAALVQTVGTAILRGTLIEVLEGRAGSLSITPSLRYMSDRASDYFKLWEEMNAHS